MRRGPPPLPTVLKQARGTLRADRTLPGTEPAPTLGVPKKIPLRVRRNPIARRCWRQTSKHLDSMNLLSTVDTVALEALCLAYARALQAEDEVRKYGITIIKWDKSRVTNPAIAISRHAWAEVRKFLQEFGLTPASRTRVRTANTTEDDEFNPPAGATTGGEGPVDPKKNPRAFLMGPQLVKSAHG